MPRRPETSKGDPSATRRPQPGLVAQPLDDQRRLGLGHACTLKLTSESTPSVPRLPARSFTRS
jgi:hypothetical protein